MAGPSEAVPLPALALNVEHLKLEPYDQDNLPPSYRTSVQPNHAADIISLVRGHFGQQSVDHASPVRKLGVMFRDLRVLGLDAGTAVQNNLASLFNPRNIVRNIDTMRRPPLRDIISGFEGVVLPGEMLLVLGRPGSGCSTFLKTLANQRGDYHDVLGDVFYDSFSCEEIAQRYRGDVIYCPEDDVHFATLNVKDTLDFSSTMRTPNIRADNQSRKAHATHTTELLTRIFGLEHARQTIVGDVSLRGISGGEKKRVSISEIMSARGKLICWDNTTRGLDSSTALEFIQFLRVATDTAQLTTIASIYQAGEQLFELFDKVCVVYDGKMAYLGPAKEAKHYFMSMGYEPQNRQTTADFLVASTDPNARKFRDGFQGAIPRTADEMVTHFRASVYGQLNRSSIDSYHSLYVNKPELKNAYEASAAKDRGPGASKNQSYTLSIPMQVGAVMRRRWQILKGDWLTQSVQLGSGLVQAVLIGTIFLRMNNNTGSYFSRGSVIYFALFVGCFNCMAEIPGLFFQRRIVRRHQKAALYHPFIEGLAHTIVDIPITFISNAVMSVIVYFLVGLQKTAGQFFVFLLFTFVATLVIKLLFRSVAASSRNEASSIPFAGLMLLLMVAYTGYTIPLPNVVGALRWIRWINPLYYSFEALMVNEFHTLDGTCTTLVPTGPGYENATLANQVCTTIGSQPGMSTVSGSAYVNLSFGYTYSDLWRNLGILCAFGVAALVPLFLAAQYKTSSEQDNAVMLFKAGSRPAPAPRSTDEEKGALADVHEKQEGPNIVDKDTDKDGELVQPSGSSDGVRVESKDEKRPGHDATEDKSVAVQPNIFSWKDIEYEVPVAGGEMRKLLDDVAGYVAPGKLTALMGESGAGKTTLLNVLAQRTDSGVVRGDCLVNGHPLPADFAAQTAYVQQLDIHIPESTVREALLFSARLRQPPSVPTVEKDAYVDKCLKMCGLEAYADAIVGTLGVEQRKRTTIGVELAAKPKLLLFLDEPTSGLDSQSAWAIIKFLRELADNGQAILCTIHQPSGELFQQFDRLLLLRKGGQTVYFGDVGERSMTMIDYFQRNGAPHCPPNANPAEYMLDVIGAGATAKITTDWHQIWKDSPEATRVDIEIERIHAEGRSRPVESTGSHPEFASSWVKQVVLLTQRGIVCYWRNPTYVFAKWIICCVAGLLIGFTFFGVKNTLQGTQDKLFSIFMVVGVLGVTMSQHLQPKFIESRSVYEIRERPSRMFTWSAFLVSQIFIEVPWNAAAMCILFFSWYWTSSFESARAGYTFLFMCIIYPIYVVTFGQAIAVFSPNGTIAFALTSALFSLAVIFCGVLQRYSLLGWWKWMYYTSPMTYVIEGVLGQAIGNQLVACASTELVPIEPPSGMTCGAYMNPYISFAGGYLLDPNATGECAYCAFRTTNEFMQANYNILVNHHWRDLGIIVGFTGFNILFMFFCMYSFRVHNGVWSLLAHLRTKD